MDNQNNMTITAANSTFYLIVPGLLSLIHI